MRRLFLLLFLLLALPVHANLLDRPSASLGGPSLDNSSDFLPVRQAFQLSQTEGPDDRIHLQFIAAEGYYLYRHRFQFHTEPADIGLGAAELPKGEPKHDEFFGDVEVYHGILEVTLPRPASAQRPFTLVVTYQGCADKGLCYPPETERLAIAGKAPLADTPVASKGEIQAPLPTPAQTSIPNGWRWRDLALFFLAGLGLTFTPCVLPMLPILSGVVLRGKTGGWRGFALSLAYVLPMAACFAVLGALMGLFGAGLNLQAQLQSAWVLVPFAAFFVIFALAMFGLFELRLPQALSTRLEGVAGRVRGGSLLGAAALGVLSSLLVSPCVSAPLAGALLYISASGDAVGGGLKLLSLGLGMGAPLVLIATGGAAWLPRSGAWMVAVKQAIGVLLLAVALFLVSRILPNNVILLLAGILAAGCGLFLGALDFGPRNARQRLGQLAGLLLLFYGLACWYGALSGQGNLLAPLAGSGSAAIVQGKPDASSDWQTVTSASELDKALGQARDAGQPVILDWYADWCISCKVIEHEVLADAQVKQQLQGYRLLRFDITESNPAQRAVLDRYRLFGPPALLFFDANGTERTPARVVGEVNVGEFSKHLAGVRREQGL